ncbi:MAG: hypothetical protein JKY65_25715 [Planctomycetes bacterium]|nr:hypothetical protein [Planctomycetota bacterium]
MNAVSLMRIRRVARDPATNGAQQFGDVRVPVGRLSEVDGEKIHSTGKGSPKQCFMPEGSEFLHPPLRAVFATGKGPVGPEEVEAAAVRQGSAEELNQFEARLVRSSRTQESPLPRRLVLDAARLAPLAL